MTRECEVTCIVCPLACRIKIFSEGEAITKIVGYQCKKGKEYAIQEFTHPMRVLTATVRTDYPDHPLLSVRTDRPIPKKLLKQCMYLLSDKRINHPVGFGEIIIENLMDTKVNLVATQDLAKT